MKDLWSLVNAEQGGAAAEHSFACRLIGRGVGSAPLHAPKKQWQAYVNWLRDGVETGCNESFVYKIARYWSLTQVFK